jgi:hypothetical protein
LKTGNSFFIFLNKLKSKTEDNSGEKEQPSEIDKLNKQEFNDEKENEWQQEYEVIYKSYALER